MGREVIARKQQGWLIICDLPDVCKTRGNKCHSFLENDNREKARQKKMVAGREHIKKNGCKNNPIPTK